MTSMTQLSPLSLAIVIKPLRIKGFFPALERHRLPELRLFTAFMRTLRRNGALQNSINKLINPAERRVTEAVQQLKQILQETKY